MMPSSQSSSSRDDELTPAFGFGVLACRSWGRSSRSRSSRSISANESPSSGFSWTESITLGVGGAAGIAGAAAGGGAELRHQRIEVEERLDIHGLPRGVAGGSTCF